MIATPSFGSLRAFLSLLLLLTLPSARAAAQYLYLDANGDGVHTAADAVAPGTTSVDVWLRTNTNRDGSPASCVSADGALTINSYEFILRTSNGAVSWGAIENRIADFTIPYGIESSGSDYHAGFVSGTILPPGSYRLATVPATATGGTPTIEIAVATPLNPGYRTSFGSQCSGNDFDNTLKLGSEWIDTDGLAWGGTANQAPSMAPLTDMSVAEGQTADQPLSATDLDGNAITFSGSPLAFMSVTTTNPGSGTAAGTIHLAPGATDGGSYLAEIRASDGFASTRTSFHIDVAEGLSIDAGPVADMTVASYGFAAQNVTARDLDNRPLEFAKVSGPDFMTVRDRHNGTAEIRLDPGLHDAGAHPASIVIRDGVSPEVIRTFQITVAPPPPCGSGYCYLERNWTTLGEFAFETHLADVNGDSRLDLVTAVFRRVIVRLGRGNGAFGPDIASLYQGQDLIDLYGSTTADLNGDGRADLLLPLRDNYDTEHSLVPLYGQPDGSMTPGSPITTENIRGRPLVGDLNLDGMPDVVVRLENYSLTQTLLLFFGAPGGAFLAPVPLAIPAFVEGLGIADFNGDGSPDLAVASHYYQTAYSVFLNHGDGTFDAGPVTPSSFSYPSRDFLVGDWNGDARPDLVSSLESGSPGAGEVLLGQGAGTFTKPPLARWGPFGEHLSAGDVNGDGKADLIASGWSYALSPSVSTTILFGRGDGTFQGRADLPQPQHRLVNADVGDLNGDGMADLALNDTRTLRVLLSRGYTPGPNHPPYFSGIPDEYHADNQTQRYITLSVRLDDPDNDPFQNFAVDQSSLPWPLISFSPVQGIPGWFDGSGYVYSVVPPGTYPIIFSGTMGGQTITKTLNLVITGTVPEIYSFEAVQGANSRSLALTGTAPRSFCFGIEPVGDRFRAWDVAITKVVMKSDLGSVSIIHALTDKGGVVVDRDSDGVQEIEACFSGADLAKLFSSVAGRRQVTATVEAFTYDFHKIAGTVTLSVVGGADATPASAFVSPNPLNPEGVLVFGMPNDGPARVELFDVRGRRVRTLVNETSLAEGRHEVRIDGTNGRGEPLASGVYYYRVTTPGGTSHGRFAILK